VLASSVAPASGQQFDTSSGSAITIANGANSAISATGGNAYLAIINDSNIEGDIAAYLLTSDGAGTAIMLGSAKGMFVSPTTSPAAGHAALGFSSGWKIYNNQGNSINFKVMLMRVA